MSEVQSRPPAYRGRASRGGRGGHSFRGGRSGGGRSYAPAENGAQESSYEQEGEIGLMKKKYSSTLPTLKELFPDWTDDDLVFALEDADGDLESAVDHITEGQSESSSRLLVPLLRWALFSFFFLLGLIIGI